MPDAHGPSQIDSITVIILVIVEMASVQEELEG